MIQPKTLPGFMELLPQDQIQFNRIKNIIQDTFESYGFLPIDTPEIELAEILLAKAGGETEKQIYRFNKGDNDLALRFDLTVPLAKYVAKNYGELTFPFRRYQIAKVFRGERPQKGRYREFYQTDIDIIGDGELSISNDALLPKIIYSIFKELDVGDFKIYINNRKLLSGYLKFLDVKEENQAEVLRVIDKIEKMEEEKILSWLVELIEDNEKVNKILEFIKIDGNNDEKIEKLKNMQIDNEIFAEGLKELEEVTRKIKTFGVPDENFEINLSIVRGLDYYTGTVYETFLVDHREFGSVCSGGRYDNLAEHYTDKKLPGVGISIGLTRFFKALKDNNLIKEYKSTSKVLVVPMIENLEYVGKISNDLRENGINNEIYLEDKKIKTKFKYADKLEIPYVIVIGESEVAENKVTLKEMESGEQSLLTIEEAINKIKG